MQKVNLKKIPLTPKELMFGFQHMFAMLGATVLVPILSNMSISMALLAAGIGTIVFYFITKKKVPVFLRSSFAFLPALQAILGQKDPDTGAFLLERYGIEWQNAMAAVCISLVLAGLVYVVLAVVIKTVGVQKVKKLFPPIVVGPVIIIIGMILAPKMFYNNIIGPAMWNGVDAWKEWTTAIVTALVIVIVNAYAKPKSFLKVIPILLGFAAGYVYAFAISFAPGGSLLSFIVQENGKFAAFDLGKAFSADRIILFQNIGKEFSFYKGFANMTGATFGTAALMIVPLAIVTFMEHLGDISANSTVCGKDFMVDPGLHRTVMGDGIATALSGLLGGPANTTYGENTAVLAITQNYSTKNIFIAACLAVVFGLFTVFADFLATIPAAVIGGASIILFGMISASGLRAMVEGKVDFGNTKNLMVVSITLAIGLGLGAMSLAGDITGNAAFKIKAGDVEISPLAIATVLAIVLNLIIPDSKPRNEEELEGKINLTSDAVDVEEIAKEEEK